MRFRTAAALILAVLLTALRPCRAENVYNDPARHFSIQFPDDWHPGHVDNPSPSGGTSPGQVSILAVYQGPGGQPKVVITLINENASLTAFADKTRDEIREKMISGSSVTVEGDHDRVVSDVPLGRAHMLAYTDSH